ncbi:hypothetical protein BES34_009780 [Leptospira inadai serovar Lyme]|uniref:Uncharacterized protein n=1 Tax=Leptospira inadai serovar Lyme TaxID=293084 RepID=A0ABX4YIQ9_9LEPT|nr:hypothetical protein BES34_009780 [Leptospira inadai serovar Lyme]
MWQRSEDRGLKLLDVGKAAVTEENPLKHKNLSLVSGNFVYQCSVLCRRQKTVVLEVGKVREAEERSPVHRNFS